MRKTIGLLAMVILACVGGFAQNSTPQWKVIRSGQGVHQSSQVPQTTLFTPTKVGAYRFTAYISSEGNSQNAGWTVGINWVDSTGITTGSFASALLLNGTTFTNVGPVPFSVQPGTPVSLEIEATSPPPIDSTYTFWFTIEQLQ